MPKKSKPDTHEEWYFVDADLVRKGNFRHVPKVGDRCLFERFDGFRFYGLMTGRFTVKASLYGVECDISTICRWKPAPMLDPKENA